MSINWCFWLVLICLLYGLFSQLSWYKARKENWVGYFSSSMVFPCVTPHQNNQTHFLAGEQISSRGNGKVWSENGKDEEEEGTSKKKTDKERECHETKVKSREGWHSKKKKKKAREMNPWGEAVSEWCPPGIMPVPTEVFMPLVCAITHWQCSNWVYKWL